MAHRQKDRQAPSDMQETKHSGFRNKDLLQDKKDRYLEKESDQKSHFGNGPKKLGKRAS